MLFFNIKEQHFYNSDEDAVTTEQAKPYATLKFLNFGLLPLFPIAINKSALADDKRKSVTTRSVPLFSVLNKFVGSLIFLFVAAWYWSNYTAKIEYEKNVVYSPQVNDFYFIDQSKYLNESYYQKRVFAAKVVEVLPKKLILAFSRYTYSRERDLVISARSDNFVQQGYFFQKPVELNRSEVIELFERGTIYNAFRPHAMKLFGGFVTKPKKLSPLYKGFHLDGANQDGIAFYQDYDYESALEAFTRSAEQGDSWGQLNLAQMYLAGEGTEKNIERAVFWLKKSLSQNNQKALELCKTLSECKLEN